MHLEPGLNGRATLVVSAPDTALAMHAGDVEVLATPRLIALCEEASCCALAGVLAPGKTSVAGRVQFDHLAPVRVGSEVTAEATLERVEGRRLIFTVSASDKAGLVGAGRVTRVVVEHDGFMAKAR
ncbi:MAG TPA: hotdog domain-containing protein [Acidimicrobiales bacterium]|nr:hotdog domain-containing protein [Acidimicrobiales bacterium]